MRRKDITKLKGSLICVQVYQYLKSDIVEFHAVLFSCCSAFLQLSFLSLHSEIKYHEMLQWGVQSIAATGFSGKHNFVILFLGSYGQGAQHGLGFLLYNQ